MRALLTEGSVQGRTERQLQKQKTSRKERGQGSGAVRKQDGTALGIPQGPAWPRCHPAELSGPASMSGSVGTSGEGFQTHCP